MEKPPVFRADDLRNIKQSYDENGFVCVWLLKQEECDELVRVLACCARLPSATQELKLGARGQVLEQWRELILEQPWTDEYKITLQGADGRELDVNR